MHFIISVQLCGKTVGLQQMLSFNLRSQFPSLVSIASSTGLYIFIIIDDTKSDYYCYSCSAISNAFLDEQSDVKLAFFSITGQFAVHHYGLCNFGHFRRFSERYDPSTRFLVSGRSNVHIPHTIQRYW